MQTKRHKDLTVIIHAVLVLVVCSNGLQQGLPHHSVAEVRWSSLFFFGRMALVYMLHIGTVTYKNAGRRTLSRRRKQNHQSVWQNEKLYSLPERKRGAVEVLWHSFA
jgi:hypothetical protein